MLPPQHDSPETSAETYYDQAVRSDLASEAHPSHQEQVIGFPRLVSPSPATAFTGRTRLAQLAGSSDWHVSDSFDYHFQPLNATIRTFGSHLEGSNVNSARSITWGWLTDANLIPPVELADQRYGTDYILIAHKAEETNLEQINEHGLKTLAQLQSEEDVSDELRSRYEDRITAAGFGPDPSFIYTRPLGIGQNPRLWPEDIVFAVHPDDVVLFNEEGNDGIYHKYSRISPTITQGRDAYMRYSMRYKDYIRESSQAADGLLDRFGRPWSEQDVREYYPFKHSYEPEILLRPTGASIDLTSYAVPHDIIPKELKYEQLLADTISAERQRYEFEYLGDAEIEQHEQGPSEGTPKGAKDAGRVH